jgi:putative transposase
MATSSHPYHGFRFPAEVIEHAVWLYHCFSLSLRDVELILAARGIVVSYESIREWGLRFGRLFANKLMRRRPRPGDKWHMDEVFVRIRASCITFGARSIVTGALTAHFKGQRGA